MSPRFFSRFGKPSWLDGETIAVVLTIKFLILICGLLAYQIVSDQPVAELYWWQGRWKHWDATSYVRIASEGYSATNEHRFDLAFFPLFPALAALFSLIFKDPLFSAFVVAGISSVALGLIFRELVKLDFSAKTARFAVLFLFIFPTSYFLHIPYTESLFLTLACGAFLAARKRRWLMVGVLGFFACLTRLNGLVLCLALLFEVWAQYRETRRFDARWLWLLLVPCGFGGYLLLNYWVTGNPLMFLIYQREHWFKQLSPPWWGIWERFKSIFGGNPNHAQMVGVQESLFILIGFVGTLLSWRYLRTSYAVWMTANWLLFVSTSFIISVPRYTLTMFPIFILMALAARRSWTAQVLFTVWSILFLAIFSTQYVRGWWAF